jgi:hypothetical protein
MGADLETAKRQTLNLERVFSVGLVEVIFLEALR